MIGGKRDKNATVVDAERNASLDKARLKPAWRLRKPNTNKFSPEVARALLDLRRHQIPFVDTNGFSADDLQAARRVISAQLPHLAPFWQKADLQTDDLNPGDIVRAFGTSPLHWPITVRTPEGQKTIMGDVLAATPDGRHVVAASVGPEHPGYLNVYARSGDSFQLIWSVDKPKISPIHTATISNDGRRLAFMVKMKSGVFFYVYDRASADPQSRFRLSFYKEIPEKSDAYPRAIRFDATANVLLIVTHQRAYAQALGNLISDSQVRDMQPIESGSFVTCGDLSPSGRRLVLGTKENKLLLYQKNSAGNFILLRPIEIGLPRAVRFSANSDSFAVVEHNPKTGSDETALFDILNDRPRETWRYDGEERDKKERRSTSILSAYFDDRSGTFLFGSGFNGMFVGQKLGPLIGTSRAKGSRSVLKINKGISSISPMGLNHYLIQGTTPGDSFAVHPDEFIIAGSSREKKLTAIELRTGRQSPAPHLSVSELLLP